MTDRYDQLNRLIEEGCDLQTVIDYVQASGMTAAEHNQSASPLLLNVQSPVFTAASTGAVDIMRFLLSIGFDFLKPELYKGDLYIHLYVHQRFLLFPIHEACLRGHLNVVKLLIDEYGVDINFDGNLRSMVPLWFAIIGDSYDVVVYLISKGVSVDMEFQDDCQTPLQLAVYYNKPNICRFLISQGADVRSDLHCDILCQATSAGIDTLEAILEADVDINMRDDQGYTPFLVAVSDRNEDILRLLYSKGADPCVVSNRGESALQLAVENHCTDIIRFLILDVNIDPMKNMTIEPEPFICDRIIVDEHVMTTNLELLVKSGYVVTRSLYERLEEVFDTEGRPSSAALMRYIRETLAKPRSLQELVNLKIRRLLGRNIANACSLPLPASLIKLVQLKHL